MSIPNFLRCTLLLAILSAPAPVVAQRIFPGFDGETVQGVTKHLPVTDSGSWTIYAVICGRKAQPILEEWFAPCYNQFVMKSGLFAASYSADLYLVPIFAGLDKAAYGPSISALRKEVDEDVAEHVIFFKGEGDRVIQALGIEDRNIPYFFTVDPKGNIVHQESGKFNVDKLDALEEPML